MTYIDHPLHDLGRARRSSRSGSGTGEVLSAGDEADFLVAFYQHSYEEHIDSSSGWRRALRFGSRPAGTGRQALRLCRHPHHRPHGRGDRRHREGQGEEHIHPRPDRENFRSRCRETHRSAAGKIRRKKREHPEYRPHGVPGGYGYPSAMSSPRGTSSSRPRRGGPAQVTMDGNQALAYGLIAGGVRYGAAYPITPWSTIMETLRREFPKYGGLFVQCGGRARRRLDGARLFLRRQPRHHRSAPARASRSRAEAIGWASMAEIPAHHRQCPARRPQHRPADQCRAERPIPGHLRRPWRQPARRPRAGHASRIASIRPSRPRASPANTARRSSSSAILARHAHPGVRRARPEKRA